MSLPATLLNGYLPPGVHVAALSEVITRFGTPTPRRQVLANRLQELLALARATGRLQRVFIWGSFVTDKPFPRDLDVFLLMQEGFDRELLRLPQAQRDVFNHQRARLLFEAEMIGFGSGLGTTKPLIGASRPNGLM